MARPELEENSALTNIFFPHALSPRSLSLARDSIAHGMLQWLEASQGWMWTITPIVLYLFEKSGALSRKTLHTQIMHAEVLEGPTAYLRIAKPAGFTYLPGQYLFLCCPKLSRWEYHPFTISSAPHMEYLELHIRDAGDWTGTLVEMLKEWETKGEEEVSEILDEETLFEKHFDEMTEFSMRDVLIDGPLGAPSQEFTSYEHLLLIGAGIGVTPFASILKHIIFVSEALKYPDSVTSKLKALKGKIFELPDALGDDAKRLDKSLQAMSRNNIGSTFSTSNTSTGSKKGLARHVSHGVQDAFDEVQASMLMKELMEIMGELETELSGTIDGPLRRRVIRLNTLDFHWLTRGKSNFSWFAEELKALKMMDLCGRFKIHLHLTSAKGGSMEKAIVKLGQAVMEGKHLKDTKNLVTGLHGVPHEANMVRARRR